jgi:hypothetical protein
MKAKSNPQSSAAQVVYRRFFGLFAFSASGRTFYSLPKLGTGNMFQSSLRTRNFFHLNFISPDVLLRLTPDALAMQYVVTPFSES